MFHMLCAPLYPKRETNLPKFTQQSDLNSFPRWFFTAHLCYFRKTASPISVACSTTGSKTGQQCLMVRNCSRQGNTVVTVFVVNGWGQRLGSTVEVRLTFGVARIGYDALYCTHIFERSWHGKKCSEKGTRGFRR